MMTPEKLAELDYEAAQAEKRDKLNTRLQVWSLLIALVGGFGLASVQAGSVSSVVALFPLLGACVARYAGHSESVLDQVKAYLLQIEQESGYCGYESYNRMVKRRVSGGHKKALRDALVLMEVLATVAVVVRLAAASLIFLAVTVLVVEILAIIATVAFLREVPHGKA
jgi:fatty acid desaturase